MIFMLKNKSIKNISYNGKFSIYLFDLKKSFTISEHSGSKIHDKTSILF